MSRENFSQKPNDLEIKKDPHKGEIDLQEFENKIRNASPSALQKIGSAMKQGETWVGMMGLVLGAYIVDQAFNNQGEVTRNIVDQITGLGGIPDPEKVAKMLLCTKVLCTTFLAKSGILTYVGYIEGTSKLDSAQESAARELETEDK